MGPRKTMDEPVALGVPLPDATPAPGCTRCQKWARDRSAARTAGDWTRVSDCNILIRRCLH
jgi:hypothetical protein